MPVYSTAKRAFLTISAIKFSATDFGFTILLAAVGGALLWRREERSWLLLAPLYVLGLTLAQMLVEVAGRYHYSMLPMLLLMGVWGLFEIKRDKKERI